MKILKDGLFWVFLASGVGAVMLTVRCGGAVVKMKDDYQRKLQNEKTQFIEQCKADGYSKTDCVIKYRKI